MHPLIDGPAAVILLLILHRLGGSWELLHEAENFAELLF
jgi:hypothetical protein